jgi:hypothetical protein
MMHRCFDWSRRILYRVRCCICLHVFIFCTDAPMFWLIEDLYRVTCLHFLYGCAGVLTDRGPLLCDMLYMSICFILCRMLYIFDAPFMPSWKKSTIIHFAPQKKCMIIEFFRNLNIWFFVCKWIFLNLLCIVWVSILLLSFIPLHFCTTKPFFKFNLE